MPDLLTGPEELEIVESISALENAITRLNPVSDAASIASLQSSIDALNATIAGEIPTAFLCPDCNPREELPDLHCTRSGHAIGEDGFAINQPAYLPLGVIP